MDLKEYVEKTEKWEWGKVFILKSERFGIHTFLVSKHPGKTYEERNKFIDINSEWSEVVYYSSVQNDEILEVFDSLTLYNNRNKEEKEE